MALSRSVKLRYWKSRLLKPITSNILKQHVVWGVSETSLASLNLIHLEDGFIRSVGLGSNFVPPRSLVLDGSGIYFDPRTPSDLEHILCNAVFTPDELDEARIVRQLIEANGITKYNLEPRDQPSWSNKSNGRTTILIPGQVEDDASIRYGCTSITTNLELIRTTRQTVPNAFIIYKPHPEVTSGNRAGRLTLDRVEPFVDAIETNASIISCIEHCDAVYTMTSLSGFDALLRGKEVVTFGQPFYAGWGLTKDMEVDGEAFKRRTRELTINELVAGTLLRYPIYWDPINKCHTTCRKTIEYIVKVRDDLERRGKLHTLRNVGYLRKQFRKLRIILGK
ncbi:beta-3-deoxy-D-manno-oct-2-ulosonic acid transferase [Gynuella sunshinyii]|uniref:Capsule polysaccharide export protein n=1 Tax=Gynuella sunshinyii YC6258 TaxID=1445510 RepID=A0A0C5VRT5_9GAMM|nr:beta-3-deoxy-D-manno-oct-2-ulosonic acid transferase [Gynuella sunshinyii]AJQ97342.1 capsule polysaccharide export protein [Gynuella sunshinyii YC6258]